MSFEPLRVAIIGSGPSGLYAAHELLKRDHQAQVDLYDRLPTPGGLARSGVSPDHCVRRRMIDAYEHLLLASGRYRFQGNVEIGRHLRHQELLDHYQAVIYACGASGDRRLGIQGEDLAGSHAATEFVGWYNAHPDYADCRFDLSTERAVVIGNGNVALDVARMLLMGAERLRTTDIGDSALAALASSRVREVIIIGRRGPSQASFTLPELLELRHLHDIDIVVETDGVDEAGESDFGRRLRREVLEKFVVSARTRNTKRLVLKFLRSPVEILGSDRVQGLRVVRNELVSSEDSTIVARPTGQTEDIAAGLIFRSVGYRGKPLADLPFDARKATIPNDEGRVIDPDTGQLVPRTYVVGWLKRGPSGVIGTNKGCAQQTVRHLLADARVSRASQPAGSQSLMDLLALRQPRIVDHQAWKMIDRLERKAGSEKNRPRVKFERLDQLLQAASPIT